MARASLATLPNILSFSRLGMAAVFVLLPGREARLGLIAAAAVTDILDGYFARRAGSVSRSGAMIDAVADRFFVFAVICTLLFDDVISTTQYAVFMTRDFFTAVGFVGARVIPVLRKVTFRSRPAGKVVTVFQFAFLVAVFVWPAAETPLLAAVGLTAVYSVVDYTVALWAAREMA
jgi:phosphatidylglycerophosphate synthase